VNAVLEGYPKSKKELFVSIVSIHPSSPGYPTHSLPLLQEEVGIETDEEYGVKPPS
jgi:hypothetical protein